MNINNQSRVSRSPPYSFKSLVSFILLLCFVFAGAVPVSADSTEDAYGWMQVLDYGSLKRPSGDSTWISGNITNLATSDLFFYSMPIAASINYVDMIIETSNLTSISAGHTAWGFYSLTLTKIGGNLYRAYGSIPAHGYIDLQFKTVATKSTSIAIYSLRVLNSGYNISDIGTYRWEHSNGGTTNSGSANTSGLPRTWTIPWYNETTEFILTIPNAAALKYDYIDVSFACTWASVNAISVTSNREYIPYDYDYINTQNYGDAFGWLCTTIRIDLTDFVGKTTDVFVRIEGVMRTDSQFQLSGIKGIVNMRYLDPEIYWLQQLRSGLDSISGILVDMAGTVGNIYAYVANTLDGYLNRIEKKLNAFHGDVVSYFDTLVSNLFGWFNYTFELIRSYGDQILSAILPDDSEAEQRAEDMATQASEFNEVNDQMNRLEKPDVGSIDASMGSIASGSDMVFASQPLAIIMTDSLLARMMLISMLFMLASYVLFGKR